MQVNGNGCSTGSTSSANFDEILTTSYTRGVADFYTSLIDEWGNTLTVSSEDIT